jgi:hypothetical protein
MVTTVTASMAGPGTLGPLGYIIQATGSAFPMETILRAGITLVPPAAAALVDSATTVAPTTPAALTTPGAVGSLAPAMRAAAAKLKHIAGYPPAAPAVGAITAATVLAFGAAPRRTNLVLTHQIPELRETMPTLHRGAPTEADRRVTASLLRLPITPLQNRPGTRAVAATLGVGGIPIRAAAVTRTAAATRSSRPKLLT